MFNPIVLAIVLGTGLALPKAITRFLGFLGGEAGPAALFAAGALALERLDRRTAVPACLITVAKQSRSTSRLTDTDRPLPLWIISRLPMIRPEFADLLRRSGIRKLPFAFLSTQMVEKEELGEEDRPP